MTSWVAPEYPSGDTMQGARCRLERLSPDLHATSLHDAFAADTGGRNWTYFSYGPFAACKDYRAWIEEESGLQDLLLFAVVPLDSGQASGVTGYLRITPLHGGIEIGHIHFSDKLKRTPAATEAIYLMLSHVFELGYRRCEWKCDSLNEASCRAAERFGLTYEGLFRKHIVYKGRNRDTAWYSIVDTDWEKLKPAFERWLAPENFDDNGTQCERLSDLTKAALSGD